jgi:hypothetical protein
MAEQENVDIMLVPFTYGYENKDDDENKVTIMIPLGVLYSFRVMKDMNTEINTGDIVGMMPTIYSAGRDSKKILFSKGELELFFSLVSDTEDSILDKLNTSNVAITLLAKFLNLANALDNEVYLNALIKHVAYLIHNGVDVKLK